MTPTFPRFRVSGHAGAVQSEEAGFLSATNKDRVQELHAQTNPADLTRNINRIQQALIASAKDKTIALRDQVS